MYNKFLVILVAIVLLTLSSCLPEAGTLEKKDSISNSKVEVYKYFYKDGEYVLIGRFKDTPNIIGTTWVEQQGKFYSIKRSITIFENDSTQVKLDGH